MLSKTKLVLSALATSLFLAPTTFAQPFTKAELTSNLMSGLPKNVSIFNVNDCSNVTYVTLLDKTKPQTVYIKVIQGKSMRTVTIQPSKLAKSSKPTTPYQSCKGDKLEMSTYFERSTEEKTRETRIIDKAGAQTLRTTTQSADAAAEQVLDYLLPLHFETIYGVKQYPGVLTYSSIINRSGSVTGSSLVRVKSNDGTIQTMNPPWFKNIINDYSPNNLIVLVFTRLPHGFRVIEEIRTQVAGTFSVRGYDISDGENTYHEIDLTKIPCEGRQITNLITSSSSSSKQLILNSAYRILWQDNPHCDKITYDITKEYPDQHLLAHLITGNSKAEFNAQISQANSLLTRTSDDHSFFYSVNDGNKVSLWKLTPPASKPVLYYPNTDELQPAPLSGTPLTLPAIQISDRSQPGNISWIFMLGFNHQPNQVSIHISDAQNRSQFDNSYTNTTKDSSQPYYDNGGIRFDHLLPNTTYDYTLKATDWNGQILTHTGYFVTNGQ